MITEISRALKCREYQWKEHFRQREEFDTEIQVMIIGSFFITKMQDLSHAWIEMSDKKQTIKIEQNDSKNPSCSEKKSINEWLGLCK